MDTEGIHVSHIAKHTRQQMKQEGGREDEILRGGCKSWCSLKSIRVMLRAEAGGDMGEGKEEAAWMEDED